MLSIYQSMNKLSDLNHSLGKIQNTIIKDEYNNLILSESPLYKASCKQLQDVEELRKTFVYLNNPNLRESILGAFTEEMKSYVTYLVENQDDIELLEEITALILDFPETQELFE